ncbi:MULTISPECIES: hypothetical protein [unclassified Lysobacter]|uniref:XAC0095 family protein n=1 Tax=unclassified Lysobacter TaxID=2635362 RepID=UPI0006F3710E|nr:MULTISPECIES: hypothetical protein [unclassified Lysobacter]KRC31528.1 hypothetical protein ASE10_17535 [Lysobacter sp. Root76]KRD65435.1 hypothetical protein ASE45_18730 [Lysobacter sp. Root96]
MRNGQRTDIGPINGFHLSLKDYVNLGQARDQLRLLGDLAAPVGEGADDRIALSAEALADCFVRLAEELEGVIDAATPVTA